MAAAVAGGREGAGLDQRMARVILWRMGCEGAGCLGFRWERTRMGGAVRFWDEGSWN